MTIDASAVRKGFPALTRSLGGETVAYLDGPGGTQVHESVIHAMAEFMSRGGSNLHGPFETSVETDATVTAAREAVADLFGSRSHEIVFGQNMTSLTYSLSRALARTWAAGDNIVLTRLDHDANVSPWVQAASDRDVEVRFVDFDPDRGCELDLTTLDEALNTRTRLFAFTHASNALGTITPATHLVELAHAVGALTYVDAVHYTPHGLVDVAEMNTDFLAASAYKWFGPHTGCLYGRSDLLEELTAYKIRPAPNKVPDKWESGTQSFESIAGVAAAVDYMASLGTGATRRDRIVSGYSAIANHEAMLSDRFLDGIESIPSISLYGKPTTADRTPTFAIDVAGMSPHDVAVALAQSGCFVWSGDHYAYEVMQRLARQRDGLVRIGFVHYNTADEVDRVLSEIRSLA